MRQRILLRVGATVFALALLAAACGGSATQQTKERPLSSEEAATLADSLYRNWQNQGATFVANTALIDSGKTVTMTGEVDWVNDQGHAFVQPAGSDLGLAEVWWNAKLVIERWPAAERILGNIGLESTRYISRTPDPEHRLVDRTIAIIVALASDQRENPLLIQQKPGSSFVREDVLRNTNVQILRYGERNLYWLSLDTGEMMRFESNSPSGTAPVIVDLLTAGPQTINSPPPEMIVPADSIKTLYRSLTGD